MRRLIIEEPVSRAAIWGRRIALFGVPVLVSGIVLARKNGTGPGGAGDADLTAGLAVIWAAALLAVAAFVLALAALAQIWREGRRGLGGAIQALLLAAIVLALPGFFALRLAWTPYYADLTTDLVRPPAFSRSSTALAARGGLVPRASEDNILVAALAAGDARRSEEAAGDAVGRLTNLLRHLPVPLTDTVALRDMQRRAYPDFQPVSTDLPGEEAFRRALAAAAAEGWTIVDRTPPGGLFGIGHIDAVQYSSVLRLPVDVTVRLRVHAEGTTIDVRSIPRFRLFDIGTGPRRLQRFLDRLLPEDA